MATAQMENARAHSGSLSLFIQDESINKSTKDFNKTYSSQSGIIKRGLDNIIIAVPNLPHNNGCVQVADFGCSQGKNSIFIINNLLDQMQLNCEHTKAFERLTVYHVDLPNNDSDDLRECLIDPNISYLNHNLVKARNIDVKVECVVNNYYDQILDDSSLDMTFCYSSLHWVSEHTPISYDIAYDNDGLTEWFTQMSDKYLTKWLNLRFRELKKYGIISFNIMTHSNCSNWINKGWKQVFQKRSLNSLDFTKVYIPTYTRSTSSIRRIIDEQKDHFKILNWKSDNLSINMPKTGIKSVFFNQIMVGLSKYPEYFKTEASNQQLYNEFEFEVFKEGEFIETSNSFDWIMLQKL